MPLSIPLDLPNHSFTSQLKWLERWACLVPGTLLNRSNALAADWSRDGWIPVILECVKNATWDWPVYKDYVANGGFQFSDNQITDMAEQIYDKFRSNRNALYRKHLMDRLNEFRPFWQLRGSCADQANHDAIRTYLANDPFWDKGCVPWNCAKLCCRCRVDTLSQREMAQYVENGCADDPAATELLKAWSEQ